MTNIAIINGVNLNEIGKREINIYGNTSFDIFYNDLQNSFKNVNFHFFQSNKVDEIVEALYKYRTFDGIVLNPGAYTHTSIVIADAVKAIESKVIEVHISNLFGRENYRKKSHIASVSAGFISGFGLNGYKLAVYSLLL